MKHKFGHDVKILYRNDVSHKVTGIEVDGVNFLSTDVTVHAGVDRLPLVTVTFHADKIDFIDENKSDDQLELEFSKNGAGSKN